MKIAFYIGTHAADAWYVRLGCYATRFVQKGDYGQASHCEAIHEENADGSVVIASATLREGGVRFKTTKLDPLSWRIVDVPMWDVEKSVELLKITAGQQYDWRGALATILPGHPARGEWFCNEWVSAPYLQCPATFETAQFMAICMSLGKEVTHEFFQARVLL